MTTLLNCIERIPSLLTKIVDQRASRFQELGAYVPKECRDLVFVASGTSYNSAFTARIFLEKLGYRVRFYYPNVFLHYNYEELKKDALYVFISQGGSTRLVYEGLRKVKDAHLLNCAICEDVQAPIAALADVALEMGSEKEEFIYRTIGYAATVTTLWLMGIALAEANGTISAKQADGYEKKLRDTIGNLDQRREEAMAWFDAHQFSLMRKSALMYGGAGDLYPVCMEADIKAMEMVPIVTRSYELEEMIHGPQNAFSSEIGFFLFGKSGEDEEKVKAIARFLKKEIGFCAVIGDLASDSHDLYFQAANRTFAPIEYITAAQVIAYRMAVCRGRDLTRAVNASMKHYITKTL